MGAMLTPGPVAVAGAWSPAVSPEALVQASPVRRTNPWPRRLLRIGGDIVLTFLLLPSLLLLGVLFLACVVAVLAPYVSLPIVHTTVQWPSMLMDGLAALGMQAPHAVPLALASLVWLGLSSATALLVVGARWARWPASL